jgi:uncharacterized protein YodC (DUF2158 family)
MTGKFKANDRVVFNGKKMTVVDIAEDGEVNTSWIENDVQKFGKFPSILLTLQSEILSKLRKKFLEWRK